MPTLNFTAEDWARIDRDYAAWWTGELTRPLVYLAATDPYTGPRPLNYFSNYPLDLPADAVVDRVAPALAATRYYADAYPYIWLNFGPGILAGFLGSQVNSVTEPAETVWFTPRQQTALTQLDFTFDPHNVWWQRVLDLARAFVARYGNTLQLGHTDLGGNLDVLASFRTTEQLLCDVIEQPAEVNRVAARLTELWLRYYDALDAVIRPACGGTSTWVPIRSTGKTYMLQSDFAYMISPRMFEQYVMPDIDACCAHLDHGFYHLDGKGQIAHLDLLLSLPRLRGIQWIPGDGQPAPDQWLDLLKRIRDSGKLCQVFVSPEGARRIVSTLGGRGFYFVIQHNGHGFRDPEVARAFLSVLAEEDVTSPPAPLS